MYFENHVLEAVERVLAWEIADDDLGRVVSEQAALMAHVALDLGG